MRKFLIVFLATVVVGALAAIVGCSGGGSTYYSITDDNNSVIRLCDKDDINSLTTNSDKSGFSATLGVSMPNYLDRDTLKVYANGNEIAFTKSDSYDASAQELGATQIVGTVTFNNVKENIAVTFKCDERDITFTFANNAKYGEPSESLKEFKFNANTTLYDALTKSDFVYTTTFSEYQKMDGIEVGGPKIGTYSLSNSFEIDGEYEYAELGGNDAKFTEFPDSSRNTYVLSPNILTLNNELTLNGAAIQPAQLYIGTDAGSVISISQYQFDKSELYNQWIMLNKIDGADFTNAKVYVNDTLVEIDGTGKYNFTNNMPIDYISAENLATASNFMKYEIKIEGVDLSGATTLAKITATDGTVITSGDGIYYAEGNEAWFEKGKYIELRLDISKFENQGNVTITKADGTKVTINKDEYINAADGITKEGFTVTKGVTSTEGGSDVVRVERIIINFSGISENFTIDIA